jgi:MFS family permease
VAAPTWLPYCDGSNSSPSNVKIDVSRIAKASQVQRQKLHPDVLKLGVVSLLTDVSSEMIFSVFAVFFTTVAGASSALLGLIEGLADFSASSLNYVAGRLSDREGQRKRFATAGYALSTLAKLILLVSSSVAALGVFRVVERLGKGFRGPPRDAWLAAVADQKSRGFAFGVHKALDKSGAVIGPLVAYVLLSRLGESVSTYATLFLVAFVPAVISVMVLTRIPDKPGAIHEHESVRRNWQQLSPGFKRFLLPSAVFALAYFSLGFILLRAHAVGFGMTEVVLLYALFNTTCVIAAPLVGRLGDRIGRARVVLLGNAVYAGINLWLVFASSRWEIIAVFAAYGVFYAIDESQSKAFITDLEPERRATAVGVYNSVVGALYLPASLIAGALWVIAPGAAFGASFLLSVAAIGTLLLMRPARATLA